MYLKAPLATLSSSTSSRSPGQRLQRTLLSLVSAVLLADAVVLMMWNHFNVGVVVPGALGAVGALLAWLWPEVQRWRQQAQHAALWKWAGSCWRCGC
jgi:hypothetical protein